MVDHLPEVFAIITTGVAIPSVAWVIRELLVVKARLIKLEVQVAEINTRCASRLSTVTSMDTKLDKVAESLARVEGFLKGGK